jgi:hypothetical protein
MLVSAVEFLEKRVEYIEADLQFLIVSKGSLAWKTCAINPKSLIPLEAKSGDVIQMQSNRKNSLGESNSSKRQLPKMQIWVVYPCHNQYRNLDGKGSSEAFLAQFEIAARMNGWNDNRKPCF